MSHFSSAFTLKEEILIIRFYSLEKHDYHVFFLERESTTRISIRPKGRELGKVLGHWGWNVCFVQCKPYRAEKKENMRKYDSFTNFR